MPSKPPLDMTTIRSPSRASAATAATMSSAAGMCRAGTPPDSRSDTSWLSDNRSASGSVDRNTDASTTWSAAANARAKSAWKTRLQDEAERGSKTAQTRCPGADINPYLAVAALVAAGMHGVEKGLKLEAAPIRGTNEGAETIARAPRSLKETTAIFRESEVARDWLGDTFVEHFALTREWEWRQWQDAVTDWELKRYFEII